MTNQHNNFVIPKKTVRYYDYERKPSVNITCEAREIIERWKTETKESYTNLVFAAIIYAEKNRVGW